MGRLRRSRRWTAFLGAAAILGVALNGVAAAQTDPPATTAPPTTTAAATVTTAPPAPPPTTTAARATTLPAAPAGGVAGTAGPGRAAAPADGGTGPASPAGGVAAAAAAADVADVALSVVDTPDPVVAGSNISYAITVTNNGPSAAANVLLQDQVTGSETFVSSMQNSGPSALCLVPPVGSVGSVNCSIASLSAGASAVFTVVVQVAPGTPAGTVLTLPR
ncbi:MAG TPA: hypothetical protein VKH17_08000 [Acidimicrobiia bacterium]|nr:hypothetical protein [Acidimicrobiia bacterium]